MTTAGPVASGKTYRVTKVNGHDPKHLDDFVGDLDLLLVRSGRSLRIVGSGSRTEDRARVHQKDRADRDVRVWVVREYPGETYLAEALAAY